MFDRYLDTESGCGHGGNREWRGFSVGALALHALPYRPISSWA